MKMIKILGIVLLILCNIFYVKSNYPGIEINSLQRDFNDMLDTFIDLRADSVFNQDYWAELDELEEEENPPTGDEIYFVVKEMPKFPGGKKGMERYFNKNIRIPQEDLEKTRIDIVYISFIVNKIGKVRDVEMIKGAGESIENIIIEVCKAMPDWKPGKQGGQLVNVKFTIPIHIK